MRPQAALPFKTLCCNVRGFQLSSVGNLSWNNYFMRTILRLTFVFCLAISTAITASAQAPANDLFANAITINGPIATVTGSNVGATKQFGGGGGGEPSIGGGLGNFGGASVWWNWTAAASTLVLRNLHVA